jgi:hypothetical protein
MLSAADSLHGIPVVPKFRGIWAVVDGLLRVFVSPDTKMRFIDMQFEQYAPIISEPDVEACLDQDKWQ